MLCQALGDAKRRTQQSPVSPCRRWTARRGRWLPTTGGRVLSPASWAAPWTGVPLLRSFVHCDHITLAAAWNQPLCLRATETSPYMLPTCAC